MKVRLSANMETRILTVFLLLINVEHMPRDAACIVGTKAEAAPPCPWPPDASISNGFWSGIICEENLDVKEGGRILLPCRFSPSFLQKDSTLYWIRSNRRNHDNVAIGQTAFHKNYRVDYSMSEGRYDLYISDAEYMRDNGKFECRLKEDGTGVELYTKTISLTVLVPPPAPLISSSSPTALEGTSYKLTCTSSGGSPPPQITWVRTSDRELLDGNLTLGTGPEGIGSTNELVITPTKEQDGAMFTCQVWNRAMKRSDILEVSTNISVNYYPIVEVGPANPYRVEIDHTAEMTCSVDSKPKTESVRWEFSGLFIATSFRHVIPQVSIQDSGSYYCTADNGLGKIDKRELKLDVQYAPQIDISGETEISEGGRLFLTCKSTANPRSLGNTWRKVSDPDFQREGPVLEINNVRAHDGGEYVCTAFNYIHPTGGERTRRESNSSVIVNVRHKPGRASITPESAIAVVGRSVTLVCQAEPEGFPLPAYRWWKEGRDSQILSTSSHYTLENVETSSLGRYFCQPHNSLGQGEVASVDLQVYLTPRLTSTPPPNLLRPEAASGLQISCSASAKPKPAVRWFKNGVEISSSSSELFQISITEQGQNVLSTLSYVGLGRKNSNQLTYQDKGHYSCQFENQVGRAEATTHLRIQHKPVPVHSRNKFGFGVGESGEITCDMRAFPEPRFDWTLADQDHDSGIVNYSSNVTQIEEDLFRAVLSITQVRKSSYGSYECRAVNSLGGARATIVLQGKGEPEAPHGLKIDQVSSESIFISWTSGFDGGYKNTEYMAEYSRTVDGRVDTKRCTAMGQCNITGLNQYTEYSIRVQARNPAGVSAWTSPVSATTLVDESRIPSPDSLVLERSTNSVHVKLPPHQLKLLVELEVQDRQGNWLHHSQTLLDADTTYGTFPLDQEDPLSTAAFKMDAAKLDDSDSQGTSNPVPGPLRSRLCLVTNSTACGPFVVGMVVESLDVGQPWLIALIVVISLLGLVALLVAIKCVCYTRKGQNGAKNVHVSKILHPHNIDAYKAQMFAITAGENQHGVRKSSTFDINSQQIEQGSSNSQSESANSQEPLWAYQKSPADPNELHYPISALAGYDNYPGYPYIDETPTTEPDTGYFGGENKPEYYGEAGGCKNGYFGGENELTVDGRRSVINGEIMAGEYNCSTAMEHSGYSYQGLPDPANYFSASPNVFIADHPPPSTSNNSGGHQHYQPPHQRDHQTLAEGLQTPNTRARRIVHEVIV